MNRTRLMGIFLMIAALVFAGCGGGGGTSLMIGDDRATQQAINDLLQDLEDAEDERDARPTQQDLTDAQGERNAANMTLGAVRMALGLMADADQAAIETAIRMLRDNQEMEDAVIAQLRTALGLASDATATMILARVQKLAMDAAPTEDPTAKAIAPAIADPDGNGMPTGGLMKSERPNVAGGADGTGMYPIRADAGSVDRKAAIRVGGDAAEGPVWRATATVTDAGDTLNKDDMMVDLNDNTKMVSVKNQFMVASYGVPARGDFTGEVHERTKDKVTDKLKIYTDMKPAEPVSYDKYYDDSAGDGTSNPNIGTAANRAGVTSATAAGVLTLTARATLNDPATALDSDLFSGSFFPTVNESFKSLPGDDDTATTAKENEVSGMFNNIPGTFTCGTAGGVCIATKDDKDKIVLTGTWTFTPSGSDITRIMIPGVNHDADYLAFGYWVQITEQADGTMKHGIQTFATGSQPYTLGMAQRPALRGTATYNGAAAGHFVRKTGPVGSAVPTSSGHFTANARLVATFNQTTGQNAGGLAPNQLYSINGTVSDFRDVDGDEIDAAWTVDLMKAGFAASGADHNSIATGLSADTFGAGTTGGGSWEGRFFGPDVVADGPDDNTDPDVVKPTGVAGEFNAHFGNGHVVGAFGATR